MQGSGAKAHELDHCTVLHKKEGLIRLPSYLLPPLRPLIQGRKEKQGEDMAVFYLRFIQDILIGHWV